MDISIKRFTLADFLLIASLVGCCAISVPLMRYNTPDTVVAYRDNRLLAEYPLSVDQEFSIRGKTGTMKIQIKNRRARVLASNCREQICVRTMPITGTRQHIVCEPNHIVLEINSAKKDPIDAVSR